MKITTSSILILFGLFAFTAMACFPVTMLALPLLRPVQSTSDPVLTPTAPTGTPLPPTQTSIPATVTPIPATNTPIPTAVTYCDWAAFIKDVTIPDGTQFSPGEVFTKVWRLQNRGTCTWTPDYDLVFYGGAQMSGAAMQIPGYVAPGQTVDVAVTLTAPSTPGRYTGYWILRSSSGALFGTGASADETFYVDIYVKALPHGEVTGSLCYPSEFNPPVTLYFELKGTNQVIQFSIPENQNIYTVSLPSGTYYAYAWAPGYNLEGAYVHPERVMKSFPVRDGQMTTGINLCDWDAFPHARGE
jgi:hypothetical protein